MNIDQFFLFIKPKSEIDNFVHCRWFAK